MDYSDITYNRTAADAAEEQSTRASFLDLPLEGELCQRHTAFDLQSPNVHAVLEYILPNLPPQTVLSLALVSKSFHHLLFPPAASSSTKHTLRPWRYLNLGESYTAPLPVKEVSQTLSLLPSPPPSPPPSPTLTFGIHPETILQKPYILSNVRTLILDGLPSVTAPFLEALFKSGDHPGNANPSHKIQILSIRACPRLEDMALATSVLRMQEFPSSLRGIYYFSDPDMDFVTPSTGGTDVFITAKMERTLNSAKRRGEFPALWGWWVATMEFLRGKVAFDAEVCRGKAHFLEAGGWTRRDMVVTSMRLTKGCAGCGAHPKSEDYHHHIEQTWGSGYGDGDSCEVVFPPAPIYSSSLASAKSDMHLRRGGGRVALRCTECLGKRYCRGCGKWWCTPCTERPMQQPQSNEQPLAATRALQRRQVVTKDCFECGFLCGECTSLSTRRCANCRGCYCILQYVPPAPANSPGQALTGSRSEQADSQHCEWCISSTSHRRGSVSAVTRVAPGRRRYVDKYIIPTTLAWEKSLSKSRGSQAGCNSEWLQRSMLFSFES